MFALNSELQYLDITYALQNTQDVPASVASSYTCKADVLVLKSNLGGLHINFCIRGLKLSSEVL